MTHRASKRLRPSKSIHNKESPPSGRYGRPVGFLFFSAVFYLTADRGRSRTNMVLHTYSAGCSFTPPMVKLTGIEPDTPKTQHITHPRTFFLEIRVTLRGFTTQHWRKYTLKNRIVFDSRQLKSVLAPCFFIASCFILYARAFSLGNIFSRLRLQSTKFITASSFEKFFT